MTMGHSVSILQLGPDFETGKRQDCREDTTVRKDLLFGAYGEWVDGIQEAFHTELVNQEGFLLGSLFDCRYSTSRDPSFASP